MKRIQRGPVRGISLKLQEEERERRMDHVPDQSAISTEAIEVDKDTLDMLRGLGMANLPGVSLASARPDFNKPRGPPGAAVPGMAGAR
jgi:small subunit ribosomal protein S17e